jgi:hypothetical protein
MSIYRSEILNEAQQAVENHKLGKSQKQKAKRIANKMCRLPLAGEGK